MNFRVRTKIIIIVVAVFLLATGLNTFVISRVYKKNYSAALQSKMDVIANTLRSQIERLLGLGIAVDNIEGFEAQCQEVLRKHKDVAYVMVTRTNGHILFHNDPKQHNKTIDNPEILNALKHNRQTACLSKIAEQTYYNTVIPVGGDRSSEIGIAVIVGFPTALIDNKIQELRHYSLMVAIISLVVATSLLLTILSLSVTKPLSTLLSTIEEIRTSADLSKRVKLTSKDELGYLADSFNEMADYLQKTTTSIENLNREIDRRKKAERSLKYLNEKLIQSNQQLQEFTYIASHDLKEPTRKITSFGQMLAASLTDKLSDDEWENLNFMIDGADRMQQMIEALLLYSRVSTKGVQFEGLDLNEIVEQLKGLELAVKLEETNGTISVPEPLPAVKGDDTQIRQLLQNLISNALKYHKKDILPEVTIRAHKEDNGMVRVEMQDNGIGIKKEQYDKLFVMFRRLHSRDEYEGTGIGLAVCKRIVERHGGEIGIESTHGQGSTFWFTLPVSGSVQEQQSEPFLVFAKGDNQEN